MLTLYPVLLGLPVAGIVGFLAPAVGVILAVVLVVYGGIVSTGGNIWGLIKCFQNSKDNIVEFLLYFFFFPYQLYYWVVHWDIMKGVVAMLGVAFLAMSSGIGMAVLFGAMASV